MPVLSTVVDPRGESCQANRKAQLALLGQLDEQIAKAVAGGGDR